VNYTANLAMLPPLPFGRGEGRGEGSLAMLLPLPFRRGEGWGEGSQINQKL